MPAIEINPEDKLHGNGNYFHALNFHNEAISDWEFDVLEFSQSYEVNLYFKKTSIKFYVLKKETFGHYISTLKEQKFSNEQLAEIANIFVEKALLIMMKSDDHTKIFNKFIKEIYSNAFEHGRCDVQSDLRKCLGINDI